MLCNKMILHTWVKRNVSRPIQRIPNCLFMLGEKYLFFPHDVNCDLQWKLMFETYRK